MLNIGATPLYTGPKIHMKNSFLPNGITSSTLQNNFTN